MEIKNNAEKHYKPLDEVERFIILYVFKEGSEFLLFNYFSCVINFI